MVHLDPIQAWFPGLLGHVYKALYGWGNFTPKDRLSWTSTECLENLARFFFLVGRILLSPKIFSSLASVFSSQSSNVCSLPDLVESCLGHVEFIVCPKSQSADLWNSNSMLLPQFPALQNPATSVVIKSVIHPLSSVFPLLSVWGFYVQWLIKCPKQKDKMNILFIYVFSFLKTRLLYVFYCLKIVFPYILSKCFSYILF